MSADSPTVFVPIVLSLQEAAATAVALRVAFNSVAFNAPSDYTPEERRQVQGIYARAMMAVAEAVDKATGATVSPPVPGADPDRTESDRERR